MERITVLGIDPGMNGAAAIIVDGEVDAAIDLPTMGEDSKREINAAELFDWIMACKPDFAIFETVSAMPSIPSFPGGPRRGMGSASAFRFGMGVGETRGVVKSAKVPITGVVPQVWKKHYDLRGGDKEPSRQRAIQLFPTAVDLLKRKMDHQRAEAMLIGYWGWKKLTGRLQPPLI